MTALRIVNYLLESDGYNPYDIDDPLERLSPEEQAALPPETPAEDDISPHEAVTQVAVYAKHQEKVAEAARRYLTLKSRTAHPHGTFDQKGRWYPSNEERQSCCHHISGPTRSYPYSLMVHCRTVEHVANTYGVDPRELRRAVR